MEPTTTPTSRFCTKGKHMKALKLTLAGVLATATMLSFSTVVSADTAEQSQSADQKVTVKCTTGSYGQDSTCEASGEQSLEQSQKIVYTNVLGKTHEPVDTALDFGTASAAAMSLVTGAGALVLKRKIA